MDCRLHRSLEFNARFTACNESQAGCRGRLTTGSQRHTMHFIVDPGCPVTATAQHMRSHSEHAARKTRSSATDRRRAARREVSVKILATVAQHRMKQPVLQIEVMESEGCSRPTCNKLCASSHGALDRRRCNPQARPSTSFVDHTIDLPWRNFLRPEFEAKFDRD